MKLLLIDPGSDPSSFGNPTFGPFTWNRKSKVQVEYAMMNTSSMPLCIKARDFVVMNAFDSERRIWYSKSVQSQIGNYSGKYNKDL